MKLLVAIGMVHHGFSNCRFDDPIDNMNLRSEILRHLPLTQSAIRGSSFLRNGTFFEFTDDETSIAKRFDRVAQQYAERTAVKTQRENLTYGELNDYVSLVCDAVTSQEVANPVALLFDTGIELIAAMLGTLKAGRFFVLIDPAYPEPRIRAIIEDAGVNLILTDGVVPSAPHENYRVVDFKSICDVRTVVTHPVPSAPHPIAYFAYTSGTTGQPKRILQTQQDVLRDVRLRIEIDQLCVEDRLSHLIAGTSSVVKTALFALLSGASLCCFNVKQRGADANWLAEEKISVCSMTAPLFRKFCDGLDEKTSFPHLRLIRLMGDSVRKSDVELYQRYFARHAILINSYSSGETGPLTDFWIDRESKCETSEVPVGYALYQKRIVLLDDADRAVAAGAVGEIAVRSDIQPSVADPSRDPVFRTGDLGKFLDGRCLVHVGRKDFRVKVRGYSVELEEIEKHLRQHPNISECVVTARTSQAGELILVAYYTSVEDPSGSAGELRNWLAERLPDYMIPARLKILETMPHTANGKIDRHALPELDSARPDLATLYEAPRTAVEARLAALWADVLDLNRVGINDNFFDLGGDSLAAFRVVSHVLKVFRCDVPLRSLFDSPTVAAMASVVSANANEQMSHEALARLLAEIEAMTEEEAQKLIGVKTDGYR